MQTCQAPVCTDTWYHLLWYKLSYHRHICMTSDHYGVSVYPIERNEWKSNAWNTSVPCLFHEIRFFFPVNGGAELSTKPDNWSQGERLTLMQRLGYLLLSWRSTRTLSCLTPQPGVVLQNNTLLLNDWLSPEKCLQVFTILY